MTRIHLLRAVNLGARNKVPMADLRRIAEDLGATGVRTLLNTGNLITETEPDAFPAALLARIEDELGVATAVIVLESDDVQFAVENNPFEPEEFAAVYVGCCSEAPSEEKMRALRDRDFGQDTVRHAGRFVYLGYAGNVHSSKLSNALVERQLGITMTSRNMTTMLKLSQSALGH
ncbi:DUF1697 domain-containing protein [Falsarthrobacter nasiphocae]|uniref:Uncharacterized protein (DUF1697 family) n=1 Tax=Falsarthrobacter nasiphocae TaxID=189863 RepID=A0AAE3YEE5_9MICC|nr:DUF1697 domain-containing protein [Falsarthrobacter nasiphocae]MDR6891869.1 uncharacterized protein (DUF1697 family) [Falsarthrobacter nasiphocae]